MSYQPAITVDTTEVGKIKNILCLSGRIRRIITIVRPYGNHIILSPFQGIGHIYYHRQVATKMFFHQPAVHKHLALPHDGLEMQEQLLSFQCICGSEVLTIPNFTLVIDTTTGFRRQVFNPIRQGDYSPFRIIKTYSFSTSNASFIKTPGRIHGKHFTSGIG